MKKLLLLLVLFPWGLYAQEYKQYSEIVIKPNWLITSSNVYLGQVEEFFSVESAPDKGLIGCRVVGKVLEVRKSNISGSEGRLKIRPLYIIKGDEKISVDGDIRVRGKNTTNAKFWLFFIHFSWFFPGEGAKITTERFTIRTR